MWREKYVRWEGQRFAKALEVFAVDCFALVVDLYWVVVASGREEVTSWATLDLGQPKLLR